MPRHNGTRLVWAGTVGEIQAIILGHLGHLDIFTPGADPALVRFQLYRGTGLDNTTVA